MLNREECMSILDEEVMHYDNIMTLHCHSNMLEFHGADIKIKLNESQKRFFICLIKKIRSKREIINIVWYENHQNLSDNNYHQLVFQTRALLKRNGLPPSLLVTIHYIGVILSDSCLRRLAPASPVKDEGKRKDHSWISRFIVRVSSL